MGTQFWWFYDVLILSVAVGSIYAAIVRGFSRSIFRMLGFVVAFAAGFYGSQYLTAPVYEELFQDSVRQNIQNAISDSEWNVYEAAAHTLEHTEYSTIPQKLMNQQTRLQKQVDSGKTEIFYEEWYAEAVGGAVEQTVTIRQKLHTPQTMTAWLSEHPETLYAFLNDWNAKQYTEASVALETACYRPAYLYLIRQTLFLLLEFVVLVLFLMFSEMRGDMDEQMHLQKADRILALPVGILETAGVFCLILTAVRFIMTISDGQMLLFNPETIGRTKVFCYLYEWDWLN